MRREAPFVKADRTYTTVRRGSVKLRLKMFRARLEPGELDDILGVEVTHLRSIPSEQFTTIEEYDIIVQGNEDRCRVVQNAILQTIQGDTQERNTLVCLANSLL